MGTTLTSTALKPVFQRLHSIYGFAGAWALKDEGEEARLFKAEWLRVLRWCTSTEIDAAVDLWVGSGKEAWPKPGQLLGMVLEARPTRASLGDTPPSGWFAFPVKPSDLEGPRYRSYPLEEGRAKGLLLVQEVRCPAEGCGCAPCEVALQPQHCGMSSQFFSKLLGDAQPTGWRWQHFVTEHQMIPVTGEWVRSPGGEG